MQSDSHARQIERNHTLRAVPIAAALLMLLVALGTRHYGWNPTALLHVSTDFDATFPVPSGIVLYEDGGYDGMLYYQAARSIPELFAGNPAYEDSYRYQRILLPLTAFVLAGGKATVIPYAMIAINVLAVIAALALMVRITGKVNVHAVTVAANPAALVGILLTLTEPLNLFLITLFLFLWKANRARLTTRTIGVLALAMLARETTAFLIGLLALFLVFNRRWIEAVGAVSSLIPFLLWQWFLALRFGAIGVATGTRMVNLPLTGPLDLVMRTTEHPTVYLLSAICLLLVFVLPLIGRAALRAYRIGIRSCIADTLQHPPEFLLLGLLVVMLTMDAHIWGVITSIGRVVTPVYPVYAVYAAERDTAFERTVSWGLIVVSVVAAIGITSITHPFTVAL